MSARRGRTLSSVSLRQSEIFNQLLVNMNNLEKNWRVDIANLLEEYMAEMDAHQSNDNVIGTNFAEAALVIQNSTNIFSKKVDSFEKVVMNMHKSLSYKMLLRKQHLEEQRQKQIEAGEIVPEEQNEDNIPTELSNNDNVEKIATVSTEIEVVIPEKPKRGRKKVEPIPTEIIPENVTEVDKSDVSLNDFLTPLFKRISKKIIDRDDDVEDDFHDKLPLFSKSINKDVKQTCCQLLLKCLLPDEPLLVSLKRFLVMDENCNSNTTGVKEHISKKLLAVKMMLLTEIRNNVNIRNIEEAPDKIREYIHNYLHNGFVVSQQFEHSTIFDTPRSLHGNYLIENDSEIITSTPNYNDTVSKLDSLIQPSSIDLELNELPEDLLENVLEADGSTSETIVMSESQLQNHSVNIDSEKLPENQTECTLKTELNEEVMNQTDCTLRTELNEEVLNQTECTLKTELNEEVMNQTECTLEKDLIEEEANNDLYPFKKILNKHLENITELDMNILKIPLFILKRKSCFKLPTECILEEKTKRRKLSNSKRQKHGEIKNTKYIGPIITCDLEEFESFHLKLLNSPAEETNGTSGIDVDDNKIPEISRFEINESSQNTVPDDDLNHSQLDSVLNNKQTTVSDDAVSNYSSAIDDSVKIDDSGIELLNHSELHMDSISNVDTELMSQEDKDRQVSQSRTESGFYDDDDECFSDLEGDMPEYDFFNKIAKEMQKHREKEKETLEMQKRVDEWHRLIEPKLINAKNRNHFDIHEYGTRILNKFPNTTAKTTIDFSDICDSREDVARYFLATLQLANDSNVELSINSTVPLPMDCLQLTKLSAERNYEKLEKSWEEKTASISNWPNEEESVPHCSYISPMEDFLKSSENHRKHIPGYSPCKRKTY